MQLELKTSEGLTPLQLHAILESVSASIKAKDYLLGYWSSCTLKDSEGYALAQFRLTIKKG